MQGLGLRKGGHAHFVLVLVVVLEKAIRPGILKRPKIVAGADVRESWEETRFRGRGRNGRGT